MAFHAPFRDPTPNPAEIPLQWNATHQTLNHGGLPYQGQSHQATPMMRVPYHLQNANGVLLHLWSVCTKKSPLLLIARLALPCQPITWQWDLNMI